MADEQQELRQINWTEVFGFTHIFKSFKMAIHPSKLMLALAAILIIFCIGWVMDGLWAASDEYVYQDEIYSHFAQPSWDFDKTKQARQDRRADMAARLVAEAAAQRYFISNYTSMLRPGSFLHTAFGDVVTKYNEDVQYAAVTVDSVKKDKSYSELLGEAEDHFSGEIERIEDLLSDAEEQAEKAIAAITDEDERDQAEDALAEDLATAERSITERRLIFARKVQSIQGETIFASLLKYQLQCVSSGITAVRYGNIFGGLQDYRDKLAAKAIPAKAVQTAQRANVPSPVPAQDRPGLIYWALLAVHGLSWLICQHWVYAVIFLLICLAVVAFFGGAIHRIAALHFAREEKISMTQAMKFSCGKFFSFFTAPLIPLVIIAILGLLLTAGGLIIGNIPGAGNLVIGLLFILAIILGAAIAFLLIGLVAGFPLMYPTIAVEGSDSFDAISRSFSYIFARPWRAGLYGLVAVIYGAITYLFVRLFAFVTLASTHCFVKMGVVGGGGRLHQEADKLDVMWTAPTLERLFGPFNWEAMTGSMPLGAWLIGLWVFLVAGAVLAFLLSYAASSTTAIYYLLRRKVDATDLDDVYVEELEGEEELAGVAEAQPDEPEAAPEEEEPSEGE